jgi:signal-transduction protein with cAMP-binding, CBS, and nucleotidyltransferase domain
LGPDSTKMLAMRLLRDVAIRHLLTIEPKDSLRKAAKAMTDRGVGSAVVMLDGKVAGIITERDLLRAVSSEQNVDETTVEETMTHDPVAGAPGWELTRAVRTMTEGGFRHLLVKEMDDPIGIVSLRDLMDAMAEMIQELSPASD